MFKNAMSIVNSSLLSVLFIGACATEDQPTQIHSEVTIESSALAAEVGSVGGGFLDSCKQWLSGPGTCQYTGKRMPGPLYYSAIATGDFDDSGVPIYECVISAFCEMQALEGSDPTFDVAACYPAMWADDCPWQPPRQASFPISRVASSSLQGATNWCLQDYNLIGTLKLQDEAAGACNDLELTAAGTIKCCVRTETDAD